MSHQYTQTVFPTPKSWHLPSFMWQLGIGRKYGTFIMQMAWLWKELSKLHFLQLVPFCLFLADSSDVGKVKAVCQGGDSGYWNRSCNGLRTGLVGPASSCIAIEGGAGQGCTSWPDFSPLLGEGRILMHTWNKPSAVAGLEQVWLPVVQGWQKSVIWWPNQCVRTVERPQVASFTYNLWGKQLFLLRLPDAALPRAGNSSKTEPLNMGIQVPTE